MLLVREVYSDWASEERGSIGIRRADRAGGAPPVPDLATMEKRYRVAGKILLSRLRTFLAFPEWFYLKLPVNTMTPPRPTPGGLASQFSSAGHYDLGDDKAMIGPMTPSAAQTLSTISHVRRRLAAETAITAVTTAPPRTRTGSSRDKGM